MTEKVSYIEIDLRRCSRAYGDGVCTAQINVTGTKKCFNAYSGCQDISNFSETTETLRLSTASQNLPVRIDAIPNIVSIVHTPATVELGKSIGTRSKLTINFKDSRTPDTEPGGDPYLESRPYDPYNQGTFWGKFRARNALIRGLTLRWIQGDNNQSLAGMETRTYIVDDFIGPDSDGNVTIIAKDPLKLVDAARAQAPALSNGRISAALTDTATSVTLIPAGIGDKEYPSSGLIALGGEEIDSFTRSSDVLTLVRGQQNTTAKAHEEGARAQLCLQYTSQDPADIINDLFTNYSEISSLFIPLESWQNETSEYINRLYTAVIAEPTPVNKLVNELLEQTATALWWDDQSALIRLRVLRNVATTAFEYNDDIIMKGSVSIKDQPNKRVSQVWTYFGQINPLEKLEETKNYRSTLATVNTDSEVKYGSAQVKTIFSRWITTGSRDTASTLNSLILARYSEPPRLIGFRLLRDINLAPPKLVGGYRFLNWSIQDDEGNSRAVNIQTTRVKTGAATYEVTAEEALYSASVAPSDPLNLIINIDSDINNINLYDLASAQSSITSSTTATFIIEEGVLVGSDFASSYSLVIGEWPSGATVNLINHGQILGKGGNGGNGGPESGGNGSPGQSGGDAIEVTFDVNITNQNLIGGGGGGGGGGAGSQFAIPFVGPLGPISVEHFVPGSGGGGGQGYSFSEGGSGGYSSGVTSKNPVHMAGNPGGVGSNTSYGVGGTGAFTATVASGGNGGGLAIAGASGDSGSDGSGGSGGAAGRSVVQSGATATITNNGTILGAIV